MTLSRKTIKGHVTTPGKAALVGARLILGAVEVLTDGTIREVPNIYDLDGHGLMLGEDAKSPAVDTGLYTFTDIPPTDSDQTVPTNFALQLKTILDGELVDSIVFTLPSAAPDEQWVDDLVELSTAPLTPSYPQLVNEAAEYAEAAGASAGVATGAAATATQQAAAAATARSGAEDAETGALAAQSGAEAAENDAEDQAALATTERAAAQTARTGAETARTGAESARDAAAGSASTAAAAGGAAGAAAGTDAATAYVAGQKGAASGLAPLDGSSKLPEANVPDRLAATALNNAFVTELKPEQFGLNVGTGGNDTQAFVDMCAQGNASTKRTTFLLTSGKTYNVDTGAIIWDQTKGFFSMRSTSSRRAAILNVHGLGAGTSLLDMSWTTSAGVNQPFEFCDVDVLISGTCDALVKTTDVSGFKTDDLLIRGERPLQADIWVRNVNYWSERNKIWNIRELSRTTVNGGSGRVVYFDSAGAIVGTGLALSAAADTVTKVAHGLPNGQAVKLTNSTAGGADNDSYFVVNATADTFQLAYDVGGSPIDITSDGTATVRIGSHSFKGTWLERLEFTAGVSGVCKVDATTYAALYDSIIGPYLGNISAGVRVQKITGNMRGTRVHMPQVESSGDYGYCFELDTLTGGNRPILIGKFPSQLHLAEWATPPASGVLVWEPARQYGLTSQWQQSLKGVDLPPPQSAAMSVPLNPSLYLSSVNTGAEPFNSTGNLILQLANNGRVFDILDYQGNVLLSTSNRTATTTSLNDVTHSVNVNGKYAGKTVYNPTTKTLWVASGPLPADPWYDQGAVVVPQIDDFTAGGTWTKPAGAVRCRVIAIGGGGAGGSGRRGAASTVRCGGGGGAGGMVLAADFLASQLAATETVTIGAAGTGGAAVTADSTNGNDGGNGGSTIFGSTSNRWLSASGGTGGSGGTATTGTGGTAAGPGGSTGIAASTTGGAGVTSNSGPGRGSLGTAGSGASGGGLTSGNAESAGGSGSTAVSGSNSGATAGTAGGGTGADGNAPRTSGTGGGGGAGGGSSLLTAAGAGGAGSYGGGGGGGGASVNTIGNSGKGGDGGGGFLRVITYFE